MRIVSLLPSATEILFGIGAGTNVVGVTHECDFPEAARQLPKLTSSALPDAGSSAEIDRHVRASVHSGSSLYHLDNELLEKLAPDLIVTQELCAVCAVSYEIVERAAKRLTGDPRVISLEPTSLEDVFANILYLGSLTDCVQGAQELVGDLQHRVDTLRGRANARNTKRRVLVLEWTDPPMSAGHWIPGLVELAGGTPLLGNSGGNSKRIEWESIAKADPDAIVMAPCGYPLDRTREAANELKTNPVYTSLRAYHEGNILLMDGNAYMSRPGPRLVDSAEIISALLDRRDGDERQYLDGYNEAAEYITGKAATETPASPPA